MGNDRKLVERVLSGLSDANIGFEELRALLKSLGFDERIKGSHHVFHRDGVMDHYEVIIYWSNEDGVFVAEVPELPGCSVHGDTREAALAHVDEAVSLWLDTAREFGRPIPEPKGARLMFA